MERVAARDLGDALDRRPRQLPAELRDEQVVEAADAERSKGEPVEPDVRVGRRQVEECRRGRRPDGRDEPDGGVAEAARGEHQRVGGGAVEPLGVVDRDDQRPLVGEAPQDRRRTGGDRVRIQAALTGLRPEHRDIDGRPLRGRERCEQIVVDAVEQVGETAEREPGLGLGGARRK
jgi:hypothetical protein